MADPVTGTEAQQAGGQGNANLNSQGATNQNGNQQAQEPAWLGRLTDESERKEAREGWLRDADYRKKTMEIGERQKAWETEKTQLSESNKKYQDWWTGFEPTYKAISENWDKIQSVLTGKQQIAQQQQVQQGYKTENEDYWKDYELLSPVEQHKRTAEYHRKDLQAQEQKYQALAQTFAQKEAQVNNYLAIFADAVMKKIENPALDMQKYLTTAVEYSMGRGNPMQMAYATVTKDQDLKQQQEQWSKEGYERAKLELANQQQPNGAVNDGFIPPFKQTPQTQDQIREAVRQEAAAKGIAW